MRGDFRPPVCCPIADLVYLSQFLIQDFYFSLSSVLWRHLKIHIIDQPFVESFEVVMILYLTSNTWNEMEFIV